MPELPGPVDVPPTPELVPLPIPLGVLGGVPMLDPELLFDPPSPPLVPLELLPGTVLGLVTPRLRWHCSL
jgi:hypothetical protein